MIDFVNTIDLLGDETTKAAIIEKTISEFNDDVINKVGDYAFYGCNALTSIDLPKVTSIGGSAFSGCTALTSIDLPKVTSIGGSAFNICNALTSIDLPNVTSIGGSAFRDCAALTDINFPNVTSIDDYAFYGCNALTSIDLPKVTSIGRTAFAHCPNLNVIILRSQSVCTLNNTSAFNGTPFASGGTGGTAYVPQALIEQYQNETNWSKLYAAGTCNFVAIEGSEYE
jgi:hypothetical protein